MITVQPLPVNASFYYRLSSAGRTVIGNKGMQFVQDKLVELRHVHTTPEGSLLRYTLHEQEMQGSALIHRWMADMEWLQSDLLLHMDAQGRLRAIENIAQLQEKWEDGFADQLLQQYDPGDEVLQVMMAETSRLLQDAPRFAASFDGYSVWRFFLQGWWRKHEPADVQALLLPGFFGKTDLPLHIHSNWQKETGLKPVYHLENTATLDTGRFDRKGFARMLKDLVNVYNIDASLEIEMEEKYRFDERAVLQEGDMFLTAMVADWYSVTSAHRLQLLSRQAFDNERALFIQQRQLQDVNSVQN